MLALRWDQRATLTAQCDRRAKRRLVGRGRTAPRECGQRYVPMRNRSGRSPPAPSRVHRGWCSQHDGSLTQNQVRSCLRPVARQADVGTGSTSCGTPSVAPLRWAAPVPVVQALAGHEHLTTTERYMHLRPGHAARRPSRGWTHARTGPLRVEQQACNSLRLDAVSCCMYNGFGWWRRRESNPRPRAHPRRNLRACPLLKSHNQARRATRKTWQPVPVCLAPTRRDATWGPAL